jgi:hypothetical protein
VLLALPVCVQFFSPLLLDGHDAWEYFPRLTEFHENIRHGILLPRWAPDLSAGHGEPFFLFNPPVLYYAAEFWHLLGFSFVSSLNLACVLIVLASAWSMFLLGRLYFGERGGWLAAAALLYAPYFAVDLYVRAALAEFTAFPFAVLALYGFGAFAKYGKRRSLLLGAAAFAGVICSHSPAALLFAPLLAAFIVFTAWRAGNRGILLRQAGGLLLGLGLSASIWLPSLAERGDVSVGRLLERLLRYSNHFVYPEQLIDWMWGYGISVAGPNDGMSFSLGWSHLLLAVVAGIAAARFKKSADRYVLRFAATAGAVICFLTLTRAEWIWDALPLLQYVEFPWRLLQLAAICLALLIGGLGAVLDNWPRWRNLGFAAALALLIVPNLAHLAPRGLADVDPAFWTPRAIASRNLEVTTAHEYAPRWVLRTPAYDPNGAAVVAGDAEVRQTGRSPSAWSGQADVKAPSVVHLAISYFPGWKVLIDGSPAETAPAAQTGDIQFTVPPGTHRLEAQWTRTIPVWLGEGITLLSLAVLLFLLHENSPQT